MEWFKIICLCVLFSYTVFILGNIFILLLRKKNALDPANYVPTISVTVIIPARNEEQNILKCLEGIFLQDFPKNLLQVLVVDDGSSDRTILIAEKFLKENLSNSQLITLTNVSGKKKAILKALESASGKIIITRDADTFTENNFWLKSIAQHFEKTDCDLLISPVLLSSTNSFLSAFQKFENLAISALGMSMAKIKMPFVCSGANLAYKKEVFVKIDPYQDNLEIASGDDMFLLKHFYLNKAKILVNTSAYSIVYTPTENSAQKMLSQRLRWASKAGKINTLPVFFIGLLVLFMNTIYLPILCLGFINGFYFTFSLFTLTLKFIIDFLLLFLSARMYKQKVNWLWLFPAFLFNGLYVPAITCASLFVKPTWKLRKL